MHVHLKARQTTIPPYVAGCITRWLQELRAERTDILQAYLTLVKYPRRPYTPYEARLDLVLDGPILFTTHPGQTQIEAVQAALRASVQQLQEWSGPSSLRSCEKAREHGYRQVLRRQCRAEQLEAAQPGPGQAHAVYELTGESLWSHLVPSEARTAAAPSSPALHGALRWI